MLTTYFYPLTATDAQIELWLNQHTPEWGIRGPAYKDIVGYYTAWVGPHCLITSDKYPGNPLWSNYGDALRALVVQTWKRGHIWRDQRFSKAVKSIREEDIYELQARLDATWSSG